MPLQVNQHVEKVHRTLFVQPPGFPSKTSLESLTLPFSIPHSTFRWCLPIPLYLLSATICPAMAFRKALFVIDIQNELINDPETRIANPERIIKASEEILKIARSNLDRSPERTSRASPALLVFVQHEESPSKGTLVRGSKPWELFFPPRENRDDEILVAKSTGIYFEILRRILAKQALQETLLPQTLIFRRSFARKGSLSS